MINTSSEIKSIYENAKEALKSIENVSIIVLIGILLRCIYPIAMGCNILWNIIYSRYQ